MKRNALILCFLLLFNLTACERKSEVIKEAPKIILTAGDTTIGYISGVQPVNGEIKDASGSFRNIMQGDSEITAPYIKLGDKINAKFSGDMPKRVTLKDYILDDKGNITYGEKLAKDVPIKRDKNSYSFKLERNPAQFLSSKFTPDSPVIRGFRLSCTWGEQVCEYDFVIKTDMR